MQVVHLLKWKNLLGTPSRHLGRRYISTIGNGYDPSSHTADTGQHSWGYHPAAETSSDQELVSTPASDSS